MFAVSYYTYTTLFCLLPAASQAVAVLFAAAKSKLAELLADMLLLCVQAGALVGLAAAAYFLRGRSDVKALQYVGSASLGTAGGVLLHVLTRPVDNTPNKMLHELRH
eukprot:GHRR01014297.1.p2 GENE.GHRR01014297.1~~GHRR01014297.1.p2  ORF type:complete len:107 (-),score=47.51 GHRR01014297.1:1446-1766(-)